MELPQKHSKKIEQSTLATILQDKDSALTAMKQLDETDFHNDSYKMIFMAIKSLYDRKMAIDFLTLAEELRERKDFDKIGGELGIANLGAVATTIEIDTYCKRLREFNSHRLVARLCSVTLQTLDNTNDVKATLDNLAREVMRISSMSNGSGCTGSHIREALKEANTEIYAASQHKDGIVGVPSGITELDEATTGLRGGELWIYAARPGHGKTSFAINNLALHAAQQGIPVLIFSLEMPKAQLAMRMISSMSGVYLQTLRNGRLGGNGQVKAAEAIKKLAGLNIHIIDKPAISINEAQSSIQKYVYEHRIELTIIDYLQLMKGSAGAKSRQLELQSISNGLKESSMEHKIPVVALSQLSRAMESNGAVRRPRLSDLRESGDLEQDADGVVFLFNPSKYNIDEPPEIIIGKQRNGPCETVQVEWEGKFTRFVNPDPEYQEAQQGKIF